MTPSKDSHEPFFRLQEVEKNRRIEEATERIYQRCGMHPEQ